MKMKMRIIIKNKKKLSPLSVILTLDATEKFEVWTDHENLKYFRKPHKLNE